MHAWATGRRRLSQSVAQELRTLSFQSMVTGRHGRELARLVANGVMARQIAQNTNVRSGSPLPAHVEHHMHAFPHAKAGTRAARA